LNLAQLDIAHATQFVPGALPITVGDGDISLEYYPICIYFLALFI